MAGIVAIRPLIAGTIDTIIPQEVIDRDVEARYARIDALAKVFRTALRGRRERLQYHSQGAIEAPRRTHLAMDALAIARHVATPEHAGSPRPSRIAPATAAEPQIAALVMNINCAFSTPSMLRTVHAIRTFHAAL